jgi:hypothetical protein
MSLNEKKFFLFYLLFLFIFGLIFLYDKHNAGNNWTMSEWLINYQGGFTRRGLLGDIAFNLAIFFNLKIRFVIFLLQATSYLIFLIVIYNFLKDIKINFLSKLAIYTPIFLLFPLAEIESLVRKETLIFILFIFFLNLASKKFERKYCNFYIFFIFPISFLIWEPIIFLFPIIFFILYLKNYQKNVLKTFLKIFFISLPSIIIFFFTILTQLSEIGHHKMCQSLMINFKENCGMSLSMLKSKSSIIQQFTDVMPLYKIEFFIRYFFILFIGFLPLLILSCNSNFTNTKIKIINYFKSFFSVLILLLCLVPIFFAAMLDWGRVTNIVYTISVLLYFFLLKNKYIFTVQSKIYSSINNFLNNKNYYYFIFFLYCFCWNIKTLFSEKIGSFPIYRILTKSIKILIN